MRRMSLSVAEIGCTAVLLFCSTLVYGSLALAGTVKLPETGQSICYDSSGSPIACSGTGQDGNWQAGVPWPDPRFTVGAGTQDACVTDNLTGLTWVKTPDSTLRSWQDALDYANNLNLCGFTDWRMPTIVELESMVNGAQSNMALWLNTQGFSNVQSNSDSYYWSSTTSMYPQGATLKYRALSVDMSSGDMPSGDINTNVNDKANGGLTWPVRGGQTAAPADIWETGQKTCYNTSGTVINCLGTVQDGNLRPGVAWPNPRFSVNGDGTVTDNLTGLIWLKNADCREQAGGVEKAAGICSPGKFGCLNWADALIWSNHLASGICGLTDNSQAGDWRLPNRQELLSLVDFEYKGPALSNADGTEQWGVNPIEDAFDNVKPEYYWSSTSAPSTPVATPWDTAWGVSMWGGGLYNYSKPGTYRVWPVRGGQLGQLSNLTISKSENSGGTITSNPPGINCGISYGPCSMKFPQNQVVILTVSPIEGGYYWTGDPDCSDGILTMSADRSCTATFIACSPAITNSSGPWSTINQAIQEADSSDTIRIIAANLAEVLDDFLDKDLTLQGGYDCDFTEPPTSFTTITGSITISGSSKVTIGEGEIRIQ